MIPDDIAALMKMMKPTLTHETGYREASVRTALERGADPRYTLPSAVPDGLSPLAQHLGLYQFSTEDIAGYLPLLAPQGRRCLTVAASGDQTIDLLATGAKEVVTFDKVAAAGEVAWLKMQALADLDWEGPEHFQDRLWRTALRPEIFARLSDRAPDALYNQPAALLPSVIRAAPIDEAERMLFHPYRLRGAPAYCTDQHTFDAAGRACEAALSDGRVTFVHADARDLPIVGHCPFDVIVLSNILQASFSSLTARPMPFRREPCRDKAWLTRNANDAGILRNLVDTMISPVASMLAPGGVMMASYTYDCDRPEAGPETASSDNPLQATRTRQEAFTPPPGFSVEEHILPAINSESSGVDVVVIIRRETTDA